MGHARISRGGRACHVTKFVRTMLTLAVLVPLAACHRPPPLSHDAYIWQRQWTPGLRDAIAASADLVRDWRVLAAQADRDGRFHAFTPGTASLGGRPAIAVIRIDGRLARFDADDLVDRIDEVRKRWPAVVGVEIDYDCPTSRLPAYADFLQRLKQRLGKTPLSITALPTWLGSADLNALLAIPDESVLQVHAVQAPQAGLFNPDVASRWVADFAKRTRRPFRVALPTYGSRVSWNTDGSLLAVESESAALAAGAVASELYAAPATVLAFVEHLRDHRPPRLAGVVWFRLPTVEDTRAWSLATWRGVVSGHLETEPVKVSLSVAGLDQPSDVIIENPGAVDAEAPVRVDLPAGCTLADGIDGYALKRTGESLSLVAVQARPLPAHASRPIGWARCAPGTTVSLSAQGKPVS